MKKRKKQTHLPSDFPKSIPEFKAKRVSALQKLLSPEVKKLKPELSPELLFQLATYVVGTDLQSVERDFEARLKRIRPTKIREDGGVTTLWGSTQYQRILHEAVDKHLRPLELPVHSWEDLRRGLTAEQSSPIVPPVPDQFLDIADQIIANTSLKKIVDEDDAYVIDLSKEQQDWLAGDGCGICNIGDVFYMMQNRYLTACHQQHEGKHRSISRWLERNYPLLYEFYLHGFRHSKGSGSYFPSIRTRLQNLDKFVNAEEVDWHVKEAAIHDLNRLIDDDLLFASVFYSYFFAGKRGQPSDPKRRAIRGVVPYVYYLELFEIKPFRCDGIQVPDYLDCGVLLLNALAGEKVYSRTTLSKDLTSFRKAFKQLAAEERRKADANMELIVEKARQSWLHPED